MTAWKENENVAFNFQNAHEINNLRDGSSEETIKRKLRERLANTMLLVVLVGENTKNLFKYVRWEIEYAIENDIPIIAVNLNANKGLDNAFCPPILKDKLAIHIPYGQKIMNYALNNWPSHHKALKAKGQLGPHYFTKSVYDNLGVD